LASQSSLSGDFSRLYATLAVESTLTADMQGGSIFESHMVCQSSILASLLGETITMEVLLACDSETTSALTTDIRMLAPLGCEADLSADLVAATNGASLNALLRVQSTVSIPRNPGLSTKKNAKSNFKVGSIDGCVCTLTASLRTGKPIAAALGCESITNGGLVCEARFATGLHVQSAITPNAVFNITMAGALQSLASFSPGALSTNITMATVLGDTVTVTPPNLKCGVFFAAPLQAQCTLTPNAQFSIRLSAQLACDTEFTSDLITQAWAHFASDLTCAVAAHAALVTDIIMVAEPMLVESLFQADTTTGIRMACTITGGGVQVIADLLTDINLLAAFLSTQATFNDLRVYKRALVFKNGKLQQVPLGEEGMHAPAAMQAGFIQEGASGSPLYIRLGVIYESTPQDDVIV
jgi:hypothetical protein